MASVFLTCARSGDLTMVQTLLEEDSACMKLTDDGDTVLNSHYLSGPH
jgi:hypothetical protein